MNWYVSSSVHFDCLLMCTLPPALLFNPHVPAYHSQAITKQVIGAWHNIWVIAHAHSRPPPPSAPHVAVVPVIICQAISHGCSVPVQCLADHCPIAQ